MVVAALNAGRGKICGTNGAAAWLGREPTTFASQLARLKREEFIHG